MVFRHPKFRSNDAFSVVCGHECLSKWNLFPSEIDVLLTHTPPFGFCDRTRGGNHTGCSELLAVVQENIKPKIHAFGHIHEGKIYFFYTISLHFHLK